MKYLLDTSVLSQINKLRPHPDVFQWLSATSESDLAISVITLQELRTGTELLPAGRRRDQIEQWLNHYVLNDFENRMLDIDRAICDHAGVLAATVRKSGGAVDLADVLIAATAQRHNLQVATLNRRHFELLGVALVNLTT